MELILVVLDRDQWSTPAKAIMNRWVGFLETEFLY
jgi:hypothetical protein